MNLGGAASVASHQQVLQNARHVREQRAQQRQKEDCALLVQSCWRGYLSRQDLKKDLRERFDRDVQSVNALRCLCWLKQDTQRLAVWAATLASNPQLREPPPLSSRNLLDFIYSRDLQIVGRRLVRTPLNSRHSNAFLPTNRVSAYTYLSYASTLLTYHSPN